jgi:hypothetical protein
VIVKIESRNLDRAPDMDLRNGWKGTDLAGATAQFDERCGLGRATFVPMMESTDLGKCDDLASRRRLDPAGVRTILV